ncbi:MAG: ATP-binding protein [Campylobacterota bacterium]
MEELSAKELKTLLSKTTKKIEAASDNIEINSIVEAMITSIIGSEHASLWSYNETKALLLRERSSESVREISMLDQRGILAKAFFTISGGIYNYLASEKEYVPSTDNPDEIRIKSKILHPLLDGEKFLGMVTAYSSVKQIKNFDEDDMAIFETLTPFLINVVYCMHPEMKTQAEDRVYIGQRLQQESLTVVEKVEEIQHAKQSTASADATLNFLANTVHDIRTPANSMYGFLELLEDQIDNPRLLQYVTNAKESAQFINDLTTSILDRLSTNRERAESKPVQLNPAKFFADIAGSFSANMFSKEIDFNVFIDPLLTKEISVEDVKLKRIIMNLVGNANKFTPKNKVIDFSVEYKPETKRIHVSIKDTGIGIAKEKQSEIFEAFKQAEEDTSENYGGTGLGLAICAQYVKELGGELKLESELDVGSTFYFDIPINVTNEAPGLQPVKNAKMKLAILLDSKNVFSGQNLMRNLSGMGVLDTDVTAVQSVTELTPETTHLICYQDKLDEAVYSFAQSSKVEMLVVEEKLFSLAKADDQQQFEVISKYAYYANALHDFVMSTREVKVLAVDDDRINIELIKAILEDDFYKVETADDGEIALELLQKAVEDNDPYKIVYLDKHMPGLSGMEVIAKFRAYEKAESLTPIYAVSISGDPLAEVSGNEHFDVHVGKPFKKKEIKATLEAIKRK